MDLAALIIATLALVIGIMALPTVFQMFWGKPKIHIEVDKAETNEACALRYHLWNTPVRSRLLRMIGVTRDDTEISAAYQIFKEGTNDLVLPLVVARIHHGRETAENFRLPTRVEPAFINVLIHQRDAAPFLLDNDDSAKPIQAAVYRVELKIHCSHGARYSRTDRIVAGDAVKRSNWISR